MLITIGTTKLYSGALNSAYDASLNSALDALTNEDLAAITGHKTLSSEATNIDHYIDGRSTAGFVVLDETASYQFNEREQVLVEDIDGDKDFAGVVLRCEEFKLPGTALTFHTIDAADYTSILDWRVVDYAAENKLAGDAVREILDEYLVEEGITEGYIESGELLTEISIGNKTALQGLQKLAEACNFIVYLDYEMRLYFHSRTLYAAAWSLSDEGDVLADSVKVTRANPNYRNSETVIGGSEETSLQTEPFVTDGTTKTFPLGYKVNRVSQVTVNGVQKTIGQKGTDAGAYDCYYAVGSETLTFETAPVAGAGEIQYYGLWTSKAKAEDLTAIATNAARQGFGSGKIEHITIDTSLTSITAAGEYANASLAEYAMDGVTLEYKTRREGLAAGTLQAVSIRGLSTDFLITHVFETTKYDDTEYSVEAVSGPANESWEVFLNRTFQAQSSIREGVEESGVTKLYNFSHTYEAVDRPNPFTAAYPGDDVYPDDDDWPCFAEEDRTLYIEFWRDGVAVFRKQHTSTPDITEDDEFNSYSFIAPAEAIGEIDEVVWFGGDTATAAIGTGVEIFRANFARAKTILESYQINMEYLNGAV